MGAWNYQIFCNDDTCDAMCDIMDSEDLCATLQEFLNGAIEASDDYIETDVAGYGLAACAVIDSIINDPAYDILSDSDDSQYEEFFEKHKDKKQELDVLRSAAVKVLDIILGEESEMRELWEENEELYPLWENTILKLKERLK